jgi:hypothetical protein
LKDDIIRSGETAFIHPLSKALTGVVLKAGVESEADFEERELAADAPY